MTYRAVTAALWVVWLLGNGMQVRADDASPAVAPGSHSAGMRYFILDESRQKLGTRGITYINLIGGFDAKRFQLDYEGKVSDLPPTQRHRRLRVLLKHDGAIVTTVDVMDLGKARGVISINKRLTADCAVPLRDVDEVDARIEL